MTIPHCQKCWTGKPLSSGVRNHSADRSRETGYESQKDPMDNFESYSFTVTGMASEIDQEVLQYTFLNTNLAPCIDSFHLGGFDQEQDLKNWLDNSFILYRFNE